MNTLADRLRAALKFKEMKQAELQAACGWGGSNSRIGNYLSGKNEPKLSDIELMANALGISKEWLAFGTGDMHGYSEDEAVIPFHHDKRASAGPGAQNEDGTPLKGIKFQNWSLARRKLSSRHLEAMPVHGTSMAPHIRDKSTVVFDRSDTAISDGEIYVVRWGDDTLVKRLFRELDGSIRVVSDNSVDPANRDRFATEADEGFAVLGRVRWIGTWIE